MNKGNRRISESLNIPTITTQAETQTSGQLVIIKPNKMDPLDEPQNMSIRKRRNLSKNRTYREKTPEPGRTPVPHEDTTTSDDEDTRPDRTSREIEADNTYEEMKRLVQEKTSAKDPVYDLDLEEVLEARAIAANERRRRSISPFAIPDNAEPTNLERKGSFIDPGNKLLSTTYTLGPKGEDTSRRGSLTIHAQERKGSLSPSTPTSASPREKENFTYPSSPTIKKQEELKYPDESQKKIEGKITPKPVTPPKTEKEEMIALEQNDEKPKQAVKPQTPKTPETEGELVTKVIQIERTPSRKLSIDSKPNVEIRQRVVRTPSKKLTPDAKPTITKQVNKQAKDEPQSKVPPVKPARSKSASRFGGKTSESEMSEDQGVHTNVSADIAQRRKVPTPRRFIKTKSPKANRSQSMRRVEDPLEKTGTAMSQTSKEIIELMEKARARSLSIPKDDPRLPAEYKTRKKNKKLETPNKTPTSRRSRGISCPKTIQIISDKEILSGLSPIKRLDLEFENRRIRNSGYVDASQSEYTSSCYSTTPSENEYEFDLSQRTAELTRKLTLLSQEDNKQANILFGKDDFIAQSVPEQKPILRKRSLVDTKNGISAKDTTDKDKNEPAAKGKLPTSNLKSKRKLFHNWYIFIQERRSDYEAIRLLINKCVCEALLIVILCGLGGMMFKTLEGSFENTYKCSTRNVKRDFIDSLWRGSHYLREEDWKSMARQKLFEFENQLHIAHEAGVTSYSGKPSWNFMNSFVYCFTLITTIGYGHIYPTTKYGRAATIAYAVIGIPLFLIVLADFGKLFTRIIKFFWAFVRRFYYTRSCRKVRRTVPVQEVMKGLNIVYEVVRRPSQLMFEDEENEAKPNDGPSEPPVLERKPSADLPPPLPPKPGTLPRDIESATEPDTPAPSVFEIDDEFNLPISVAIIVLILYILAGAVLFCLRENWTFFESFYFVFISMSTIGLGDLAPNHPMFMMSSILYLVFGLALTSMCINVVQVKLSDTFKQASAKLGATIGLKVAEEDGSLVPMTPPPMEIAPVHKPRKPEESVDANKSKENEDSALESKNK
ncbi:Potassium channel subfamily K member 18 [Eumeta japonica]|uniref:Potassium channel subfamily K member 18 n=1 Tax=Eumeta variegata TaxID=151549 RepID=A0A4C1V2A8_EUMVA|nr:Potassium channel subfamily K member 18 [Eumeta japonica]